MPQRLPWKTGYFLPYAYLFAQVFPNEIFLVRPSFVFVDFSALIMRFALTNLIGNSVFYPSTSYFLMVSKVEVKYLEFNYDRIWNLDFVINVNLYLKLKKCCPNTLHSFILTVIKSHNAVRIMEFFLFSFYKSHKSARVVNKLAMANSSR